MIHHICIELFQESSFDDLRDRLVDPRFADNMGDGMVRYALSFSGTRKRAGQAIDHAKCRIGTRLFSLKFDIITTNQVEIDIDLVAWFGERIHTCDDVPPYWDRVCIAHAKRSYRDQLRKRLNNEISNLDTACKFLLCCERYLLYY